MMPQKPTSTVHSYRYPSRMSNFTWVIYLEAVTRVPLRIWSVG